MFTKNNCLKNRQIGVQRFKQYGPHVHIVHAASVAQFGPVHCGQCGPCAKRLSTISTNYSLYSAVFAYSNKLLAGCCLPWTVRNVHKVSRGVG
jgi:hypothetical protein